MPQIYKKFPITNKTGWLKVKIKAIFYENVVFINIVNGNEIRYILKHYVYLSVVSFQSSSRLWFSHFV